MANTLTNLIPTMYSALNVVSREMIGFIPAVRRDATTERAAKDQSVRVPVAPAASTADNTPATTAPDTGDGTMDSVEVKITNSKHVAVRFNGEETRGLQNAGTYESILQDRFVEGFRALANEIEEDIWQAAYQGSSRGFGTAGTAPFATAADLSDFAGVKRILEENGAPKNDLQLVLGHAAINNLRAKQSTLFKVNEAGSADMLRNGMTDRIMGFAIRHSDPIASHTKGTGASYLLNDAASAAGDTEIEVDGGTGTILAGDIVTFAGTTDKYVVNTALTGTALHIGKPGLIVGEANNDALTVGNSYTPNVAFSRSAIVLAARLPAMPAGGDMADDTVQITDPVSGLTFEIAIYRQYLQVHYQIRLAWGVKVVKSNHVATLLG